MRAERLRPYREPLRGSRPVKAGRVRPAWALTNGVEVPCE